MSSNPALPLNEEHYNQIVNGLRTLDTLEGHIAKAKMAGVDVSQAEADAKDAKAKLLRLKNVYFPNR